MIKSYDTTHKHLHFLHVPNIEFFLQKALLISSHQNSQRRIKVKDVRDATTTTRKNLVFYVETENIYHMCNEKIYILVPILTSTKLATCGRSISCRSHIKVSSLGHHISFLCTHTLSHTLLTTLISVFYNSCRCTWRQRRWW